MAELNDIFFAEDKIYEYAYNKSAYKKEIAEKAISKVKDQKERKLLTEKLLEVVAEKTTYVGD